MMRARKRGMVRADGRLYCLVELEGIDSAPAGWPQVSALMGLRPIPVEIFPVEGCRDGVTWIVVLPFFPTAIFTVDFACGCEHAAVRLDCRIARWKSSFNYRVRQDRVELLKGAQERWVHGRLRPTLDRLLPSSDGDVWRACVRWDGPGDVQPELSMIGPDGNVLDATVYEFERQLSVEAGWGGCEHRMFYSIRLPHGCCSFALWAHDDSLRLADGFCSCDEPFWRYREHESWQHMRDARADDARYRTWFEQHRAHAGDLASQAATVLPFEPMFSVIVPCYRSNAIFLQELVESLRAQSYRAWELVLVDASPDSPVVVEAARQAHDERIRVVSLDENDGIVGNTKAGIEAAHGDHLAFLDHDDLLEPDALFWYARALNSVERPDVLFCDEDLFETMGQWRQPIFKTQLNVDLLYSHNCVTHFLCIARDALCRIGLSSDDVTGAQDYDLVLRALGAGMRFRHVPRVLYHWREHAGSTSGDNVSSKPYADKAGRLALQRHLDSRGIAAHVEEGSQPFVYRVHYDLPVPPPLISIVIPSRDHAEVLSTCIASLFERSTYRPIEIVVVENHSVEPSTFEVYERLSHRYGDAVRILDVSDSVQGFNYSKLINLGVESATGDYLLLLNNDTEVISPDALQEMIGYLQRSEVGVVGAKLYFRDGLTQHAGVLVGPHGAVAHVNQDFCSAREGYLSRAVRPGNFSAVTGACQMMRRSTFTQVGGYDERFAVGFNDVDFCFRVREQGKLIVFTPYAELFHYEFVSRGREVADSEKLVRWKREQALFTERWPEVFLKGDPYSNPNLDQDSAYYGL